MNGKVGRLTSVLLLVLGLSLSMWGQARNNPVIATIISDFNTTIQPDVLHGFVLGSISVNRGYVVEVTPLDTSDTSLLTDGETVRAFVEPEFNASSSEWSDVLRVQLFGATAPLNVNLRVYALQKAGSQH